jgi:hypothetical protein
MNLCRELARTRSVSSTGDATVNREAPILCCTAEVLANIALRQGPGAPVSDVVMDEFHWYADRDRGVAWQTPLLTLPQTRFLLMSATLGDTSFFEEALTRLNGRATVSVLSVDRPVPLEYAWSEIPLAAHAGETGGGREDAGLRSALHPGGCRRQRAGLHQPEDLHGRGEERLSHRSTTSSSPVPMARKSGSG